MVRSHLVWTMIFSFGLCVIVGMGCRTQSALCRGDADCAPEGLVCLQGQCVECIRDANCSGQRRKCLENQCVQCVADKDCPLPRPVCEQRQCVAECAVDADCNRLGKTDMVCRQYACAYECLADVDCDAGKACDQHQCVSTCACKSHNDCGSLQVCIDCACRESDCMLEAIQFDFGKAELLADSKRILDSNRDCLNRRQAVRITIEGHCDERGTEEYNIHLGNMRALAVKKYLKALGVSEDRLDTISFGEIRPLCTKKTEECWQRNRRANFKEQ